MTYAFFVRDEEVGGYVRYRYARDGRYPEAIGHCDNPDDLGVIFKTDDPSDAE